MLAFIKAFSFVWYVIPLLKTGALASTCDPFVQVDDEKTRKNQGRLDRLQLSATILTWWWRLVASNKALNLLYWAMHAVLYRHTTAAIKMATFLGAFVDCFFCLLPWRPLGQYGVSSCPMVVSSSFRSSPGHALLGNAVCNAPAHCRGHQNGWQMRCICLSSSPCLYQYT